MKRVLFTCVHNSGRSQMAEAFAKRLGEGVIKAESAGTLPGGGLNPTVVLAMEEIGVDMGGHNPKSITGEMLETADVIITMGCGVRADDVCPAGLAPTEDWGLDDPAGQPIEVVRQLRDEIQDRVKELIRRMEVAR